MSTVDFATFLSIVNYVTDIRKPVLIRGRHGIGKSEVVYSFAKQIGLPVVERRASQMTEGDLLGLPDNRDTEIAGRKATTWNAPDWLVLACTSPVVLFLDEVDRATTEVRQGIFELTDSRKINGWNLHPDTLIFAAVNGGEHGSQYQVGEMDPAELDRWTTFDLNPTVEDWLSWAKSDVDPVIFDFINQNRTHLEHTGDYEPNKVYPSRRSWKRLNDCLVKGKLLDAGASNTIFNLAAAFVGFEAAVALNDFVENYQRQVTVEDILDNGKIDRTDKFAITDHNALADKMILSGRFSGTMEANVLKNFADYWITVPSEIAMKLFTELGKQNVQMSIALHKTVASNGVVCGQHLVKILQGKN
jgi:MoxR-like ATPase